MRIQLITNLFYLDELVRTKRGATQERWQRALKDKAFNLIRNLPIIAPNFWNSNLKMVWRWRLVQRSRYSSS
jgi:hypothetical protein